MPILAALSLAAATPDLPALDRALAANDARRAAIAAPWLRMSSRTAALALLPPSPARDRDLLRLRAWSAAVAPGVGARLARLDAEEVGLARQRAEAVLRPWLRPAGVRPAGALASVAACGTAPLHPPAEGFALSRRAAMAVGAGPGLALLTRPDAVVTTPAPGWVAYAGRFRRYGRIVVIDHGHGWTTLLTGLGRVAVAAGAPVALGAPLGRAGTGLPLLAMELSHHGRVVDAGAMMRACAG